MDDILETIKSSYIKILLVNMTTRIVEPNVLPEEEKSYLEAHNISFSTIDEYWNWFSNSQFIHPDDKEKFISFTKEAEEKLHIVYRRKHRNNYIYVYLEMRKTYKYSEENRTYSLCVKDIDDTYISEAKIVSAKIERTDGMTGLLNHKAYEEDIKKALKGNVGVAFVDINGLKCINDKMNHKAGDELILKAAKMLKEQFPAYSIYRIGGDEFVVIGYNVKTRIFIHTVSSFHKRIWNEEETYALIDYNGENEEFPMLSIGYSADISDDICEIIYDAEQQMYEDKSIFYSKYNNLKR